MIERKRTKVETIYQKFIHTHQDRFLGFGGPEANDYRDPQK